MRSRFLVLGAVGLATTTLVLVGCSSSAPPVSAPPSSASTAAVGGPAADVEAPSAPVRVDAPTFAGIVASPGITVIDVRTPEEFAEGHIAGAVNYNVEGAEFTDQIAALDPTATYAVYCRSGNRSQPAVAAMAQAGIPAIYELEAGVVGWQEAGLPLAS